MPRKLDNKFSWKNATFMAKLSKFAYSGEKEFKKVFSKQWEDITFVSKGGTECYILTCPKNYIVVFRGTEPTSWEDIKADIQFTKQEKTYATNSVGLKAHGKMHKGFRAALEDVWKILHKHYKQNGVGKQLLITGHSLGAAMATICAARLQSVFNKEIVLYTFGSPRVGNKEFVDNLNVEHHRWVNNNDAVTKVPPIWLFYKHHGMLNYLNYYGKVRDGYSFYQRIKDMLRGRIRAIKKWQFFKGVYDHSITNYEKKLFKLKGGSK